MAVAVIAAEIVTTALHELTEKALSADSRASRWLDEVTRPPTDARFDALRVYSGLVLVVRNDVRRALVIIHRMASDQAPVMNGDWSSPDLD